MKPAWPAALRTGLGGLKEPRKLFFAACRKEQNSSFISNFSSPIPTLFAGHGLATSQVAASRPKARPKTGVLNRCIVDKSG
jgi:hypothetical protein